MKFPEFDFSGTSHVRLKPDDRCLDDGVISIAWNAGTLHVQYVGLQEVDKSAIDVISETMWQFATEAQLMLVLYASVLRSRKTIQEQLGSNKNGDMPFTVSGSYMGGNAIWAWLPLSKVLDAYAVGGEFERTFAKAFVVFTYQRWEEFARPNIAQALGVRHDDVKSDLMNEWRHLRHWLIHPDKKAEQAYFKNASILAKILGGPRPGHPEVKANFVFPLMGYLNSLHVIVNPDGLDPGLEMTDLDPTISEQISKDAAESGKAVMPIWKRFNPSTKQQP